jgi:16S rRNA (cytosine967-C5)-methyltransferase
MSELARLAASIVSAAQNGERASSLLAGAIAERRLGVDSTELLSRLTYATLRRERRVRAVLSEATRSTGQIENPYINVIAAALLEGSLDREGAERAEPGLDWARFLEADPGVLARASGVERVALLGSLPDWLAQELLAHYGAQAEALAESLSEPAPRSLRVNSLIADVAETRARLEQQGATVADGRYGKRALRLEGVFNPFTTRAFHEGLFELQDEGSQIACELVAPPPRGLVVDACAGAGGKSLSVAAALEGRGKLVALDVDARKLAALRDRAKRARAANVQAIAIEESGELPEPVRALTGKVDRVLIDAPCSGTGVLRRNPEIRQRVTPEVVERLVATQREIIERMLPLLAPGGRLLFATCSLLPAEGERLMDSLEAEHAELSPVNLAEIFDRSYVDRFERSAPHRLRLLPHLHDTDGFFVTCLRKKR